MDKKIMICLINSITRFIHLVSSKSFEPILNQKDYRIIIDSLKHLKPLLDEVVDCRMCSDEVLFKECERLNAFINEAREFVERWCSNMSKIVCILQSKALLVEIQRSSLEICCVLERLLQSPSSTSSLSSVRFCMQELKCVELDTVSQQIEEALRIQKSGLVLRSDHLLNIAESLHLTSSHELLRENVALEKERMNAQVNKNEPDSNRIDQFTDLFFHIRSCVHKHKRLNFVHGVHVPSYFCCPLSLQLMVDPVILASGQTYDTASIKLWIRNGLTICPVTHEILSHTNLIPNYTLKALIQNWCAENKFSPLKPSECSYSVPLSNHEFPKHVIRADSIDNVTSGSSMEVEFSEQSFIHSRSESTVSAISSVDYLPNASAGESLPTSDKVYTRTEMPTEFPRSDDSTSLPHAKKLIEDLKSQIREVQTSAAAKIRLLTRHNMDNRVIIGHCGAISLLISLLYSEVKEMQEHAVTSLLNLSINEENKSMIAKAGSVEPLIYVLKTGNSEAKENSAAALFSLSLLEDYKEKIGRSGAIKGLVELLGSGTLRGKKDAATALFNLSIYHENKARIVQAGAVKYLVGLMDPACKMADKAVALLANLSTVSEGQCSIAREGGIPMLVEHVETGSHWGKENASSVLLQMCLNNTKYCTLVLQEGAIPPLVALSQAGSPRAKEKAQQLLCHFRSQRDGAYGKKK